MTFIDQPNNDNQPKRIFVFTSATFAFAVYLIACYLLLTVNNPFNFNNNFHLIGFVSFLSFAIQFSLALVFCRLIHQRSFQILNQQTNINDPFQGLSSLIILLTITFFIIMSPLIYFLLINEFMLGQIPLVLFGLIGLFIGIIIFGYWISIIAFIQRKYHINWWELINKAVVLIIFILIFMVIINFLTGIIPTELKTISHPYFSL